MRDKSVHPTHDLYLAYLTQINGTDFTHREIDIIACLTSFKQSNEIAQFLYIDKRTVSTHIQNIKKALGINSSKKILDTIKNSDKYEIIKGEYLENLFIKIKFEETLRKLSRILESEASFCYEINLQPQKNVAFLVNQIKSHLKHAGIVARNRSVEGYQPLCEIFPNTNEDIDYRIYIVPKNLGNVLKAGQNDELSTSFKLEANNHVGEIILFHHETDIRNLATLRDGQKNGYLSLEKENYYSSLFELLKFLYPKLDIEKFISEFKEKCSVIESAFHDNDAPSVANKHITSNKEKGLYAKTHDFVARKIWFYLTTALVIGLLSVGFFILQRHHSTEPSIISDLVIPAKHMLINRSELMAQLNENLRIANGIQTVALIGIGGSGKTVLARQYARQKKANVIWEINAESHESLNSSFEKLASALSTAENDKKILIGIQNITDPSEKEEKYIYFVKERLKSHEDWLLIYDNAVNFADIKKFLPQDVNTWGKGKVIVTTRNSNIYNNNYITKKIQIRELNGNQKFTLFTKIMNQDDAQKLTPAKQDEIKGFLKNIPSFPLDVCVAAYYLRTTHISYEQYLYYLSQQDKSFTAVQEKLLKESGEYTKTRYNIIILSLKQLIDIHKDFRDLLLLISCLDSQSIPRDLLHTYKKDVIVDDFIYNLEKYSLITNMTEGGVKFSDRISTLSLHRSTQAICLIYLIKILELENNKQFLKPIANVLRNYIANLIEKEDIPRIKILVNHCEAFLNHKNIAPYNNLVINGFQYGIMQYYLGQYLKSKNIFDEYFLNLKKMQ